jgi:hypothetical protein
MALARSLRHAPMKMSATFAKISVSAFNSVVVTAGGTHGAWPGIPKPVQP